MIYRNVGLSDVARVRHILHVINFNDIIGAQFSTSSECNWCTKEKVDSDVRCTKFEHSILDARPPLRAPSWILNLKTLTQRFQVCYAQKHMRKI